MENGKIKNMEKETKSGKCEKKQSTNVTTEYMVKNIFKWVSIIQFL